MSRQETPGNAKPMLMLGYPVALLASAAASHLPLISGLTCSNACNEAQPEVAKRDLTCSNSSSQSGSVPLSQLLLRLIDVRLRMLRMLSGMLPVIQQLPAARSSRVVIASQCCTHMAVSMS
jgi:hypothetical protein